MANKKGKSEKKTTFWGKSYIQHYDSKGNKSGRSEKKTGFFGNTYSQHYNSRGEKAGKSEKKTSFLGNTYTQKYNSRGEKSGYRTNKETWYGKRYQQHYDQSGTKTDWTESKETWYGKPYVERYGDDTSQTRSTSGSQTSSYSARHTSSGSYAYPSAKASSSSSRSAGKPNSLAIVCLILIGLAVTGIVAIFSNRSNSPQPSPPRAVGHAYINTTQLNVRHGPGTEFPVVTRLSKGAYVACLDRQRNQHGENWMHIQVGSYDGWVNEEYLNTNPPTNEIATAPAPSPTRIPTATATPEEQIARTNPRLLDVVPFSVTGIRFFESGPGPTPYAQRVYATRFSSSESRYVNWELDLGHGSPHDRFDFLIVAIWKAPDGSSQRQELPSHIESQWSSSNHSLGWGSQQKGWWRPGTYSVDLYYLATRIGTGTFEVY